MSTGNNTTCLIEQLLICTDYPWMIALFSLVVFLVTVAIIVIPLAIIRARILSRRRSVGGNREENENGEETNEYRERDIRIQEDEEIYQNQSYIVQASEEPNQISISDESNAINKTPGNETIMEPTVDSPNDIASQYFSGDTTNGNGCYQTVEQVLKLDKANEADNEDEFSYDHITRTVSLPGDAGIGNQKWKKRWTSYETTMRDNLRVGLYDNLKRVEYLASLSSGTDVAKGGDDCSPDSHSQVQRDNKLQIMKPPCDTKGDNSPSVFFSQAQGIMSNEPLGIKSSNKAEHNTLSRHYESIEKETIPEINFHEKRMLDISTEDISYFESDKVTQFSIIDNEIHEDISGNCKGENRACDINHDTREAGTSFSSSDCLSGNDMKHEVFENKEMIQEVFDGTVVENDKQFVYNSAYQSYYDENQPRDFPSEGDSFLGQRRFVKTDEAAVVESTYQEPEDSLLNQKLSSPKSPSKATLTAVYVEPYDSLLQNDFPGTRRIMPGRPDTEYADPVDAVNHPHGHPTTCKMNLSKSNEDHVNHISPRNSPSMNAQLKSTAESTYDEPVDSIKSNIGRSSKKSRSQQSYRSKIPKRTEAKQQKNNPISRSLMSSGGKDDYDTPADSLPNTKCNTHTPSCVEYEDPADVVHPRNRRSTKSTKSTNPTQRQRLESRSNDSYDDPVDAISHNHRQRHEIKKEAASNVETVYEEPADSVMSFQDHVQGGILESKVNQWSAKGAQNVETVYDDPVDVVTSNQGYGHNKIKEVVPINDSTTSTYDYPVDALPNHPQQLKSHRRGKSLDEPFQKQPVYKSRPKKKKVPTATLR